MRQGIAHPICPRGVHLDHESVVVEKIDIFIPDQLKERRILKFALAPSLRLLLTVAP